MMLSEINCAVDFLLSLVGGRVKDDASTRLRETLIRCLQTKYENHWHTHDSRKGSAYRAISNTGARTDPLLDEVSQACSVRLNELLPRELTLWVDPCEVSYRIGSDGSVCHLKSETRIAPGSPLQAATSTSPSTQSPSSSRSSSPPTVAQSPFPQEPRQFPAYEPRRFRTRLTFTAQQPQQQVQQVHQVQQVQQVQPQHQQPQLLRQFANPAYSNLFAAPPMYMPYATAAPSNRFVPAFIQDQSTMYSY